MPSPETVELLRRADQLRIELHEPEDAERDARLADALETLRRIARRPSIAAEGAAFENVVAQALQALPGVATTIPRGWRGTRPDLMVKTPDRTFVIEVKARLLSRGDVRRAAARLAEVRQSLGADHAFLVVPSAIPASVDVDSSVSIVTVPELLETVIQVATR